MPSWTQGALNDSHKSLSRRTEMLRAKNVVELNGERRAAMVSNLMVVLCGERDTQPIINAGSLYQ